MATLDHAQIEALWIAHGGDPLSADRAAAIAQAESGGCQYAHAGPVDDRPVKQCTYRFTTGENSYGLWQINRAPDAHPEYSAATLYTLAGNADAAVTISQAGLDFTAWTTYTSGAYLQYMTNPSTTGPQPPAGPLSGGAVNLPSVPMTRAWTQLMQTLAITAPKSLREARAARARMRRAVR